MWLEAPTRLLKEGRPAAALEAMLEAWRLRRVPALANLIDVLSDALTSALPRFEARTRKGVQGLWLDLANERRDVDVGRLLAVFPTPPWVAVGQRIERLAQLDDPRVARAFTLFFQNLPTVGGIGSARWTMLFSALERMKDVRSRSALEARANVADPRVIVTEQLLPLARRVLVTLTAFAPLAFHRVGPGWVVDLHPSPFELRRSQNLERALTQFTPLVTGVLEPSKDWGEDRPLARELLDGVRKRAGLEFVPRGVIGD